MFIDTFAFTLLCNFFYEYEGHFFVITFSNSRGGLLFKMVFFLIRAAFRAWLSFEVILFQRRIQNFEGRAP